MENEIIIEVLEKEIKRLREELGKKVDNKIFIVNSTIRRYEKCLTKIKNEEQISYNLYDNIIKNINIFKESSQRKILFVSALLKKIKPENLENNEDFMLEVNKMQSLFDYLNEDFKINKRDIKYDDYILLKEDIENIYSQFKQLNSLEIKENIEANLMRYSQEQKRIIVISLLNKYYDELIELQDFIKENFNDYTQKSLIEQEIEIENFMDLIMNIELNYMYLINPNLQVKKNNSNKILFALRTNGQTYFENDLKDCGNETYLDMVNLLEGFKNGALQNSKMFKRLSEGFDNLYELRSSFQIRICLERLKNNTYVVKGVFQKKVDNDIKAYREMKRRGNVVDTNEEIIENRYNQIINYLMENKRRGNRNSR